MSPDWVCKWVILLYISASVLGIKQPVRLWFSLGVRVKLLEIYSTVHVFLTWMIEVKIIPWSKTLLGTTLKLYCTAYSLPGSLFHRSCSEFDVCDGDGVTWKSQCITATHTQTDSRVHNNTSNCRHKHIVHPSTAHK